MDMDTIGDGLSSNFPSRDWGNTSLLMSSQVASLPQLQSLLVAIQLPSQYAEKLVAFERHILHVAEKRPV